MQYANLCNVCINIVRYQYFVSVLGSSSGYWFDCHPPPPLIITSHHHSGSETWSRNWGALLNTKSQEGAYSFLKMFLRGNVDLEGGEGDTVQQGKRARLSKQRDKKKEEDGDEGADDDGSQQDDQDDEDEGEIPSRQSLSALAFSGMKLVEESEDYIELFGTDQPNSVTAMDIKLLEMKIEVFLWDSVY